MKKLIVDTKIHEELGMKILNEDEIGEMKELFVDTKIHEELGMKILNEDEVINMRHLRWAMNWPSDYCYPSFEPKGVNLEEAKKVMRKSK